MRNGADRPAISTGPALMIPAGYPRDLPSALLRAARDFGTAGVVEIGPDGRETRLDFPTLLELAARILAGLRANGVRAGDPAVVHCTEPVGFFAAFWACTLGGIRPLLISPSPAGDRSEEGRERLRKVTELLGWTVLIGRPSDLPDDLGLPVLDPDALAGHEPTSDFHRPAADDVAVLMMSSGSSTGTPKITQLTHRGLVEFAAGTPAMLPVRPGQVTLNWLPLDQSGAFLLYHLLPVFTGCTNIHVNTGWVLSDPLRWLDLMDQHRVNHSWSPNFGYRLVTTAISGEPDRHWDLSALRSLVSGGEQITVPVMSEFLRLTNRFGVVPETFVAAWGMTETVTGITFARPGLTPNVHRVRIPPTGVVEWVDQATASGKVAVARPGKPRVDDPGVLSLVSVGAPAPGTTVRIVGPNGAVLPEGRIGQLQVASARVTPGYLGNPEADRAAFPVGNWPARKWLATGDQAFIAGGQVVITGRDSERIVLNGENHYAHEIEAVAGSVPGAPEGLIAACGVADSTTGTDRLVIFYAAVPENRPDLDEAINRALFDRLGLAAQVVAVPRHQFPTTPGGKILRPLLKQRWIENSFDQSRPLRPAAPAADALDSATAPPTFEEDPAERTMELPVVRLAWRREIKDSIPKPPERPTLGANREPSYAEADEPQSSAEPTPVVAMDELPQESSYDELAGDPEAAPAEPTSEVQADELDASPSGTDVDQHLPASSSVDALSSESVPADALSSESIPADALSSESIPAEAQSSESPADALSSESIPADARSSESTSADARPSQEIQADALSPDATPAGALPQSGVDEPAAETPTPTPTPNNLLSEAARTDALSPEAAPTDARSPEAAPADALVSDASPADAQPAAESGADEASDEAAPSESPAAEAASPEASTDNLLLEATPSDPLASDATPSDALSSAESRADVVSDEAPSVEALATEVPPDEALPPEASTDDFSAEASAEDLSPEAAPADSLAGDATPADARSAAVSGAEVPSDEAPAEHRAPEVTPDAALSAEASTDLSPEAAPAAAPQSATPRTTGSPAEVVGAEESTAEQLTTDGELVSDRVPTADDAPRTADAQISDPASSTDAAPAHDARVAETASSSDTAPTDDVQIAESVPSTDEAVTDDARVSETASSSDTAPADEVQIAESAPSADGAVADDARVAAAALSTEGAPADEAEVDTSASPANVLTEEPSMSADTLSAESSATEQRSDAVAPLADNDAATGDAREEDDEQPTQILSARDVLSLESPAGQRADSGDVQEADDEPTQILSTRDVLSSETSSAEAVESIDAVPPTDDELSQADSLPSDAASLADVRPADRSSAELPAHADVPLNADAPSPGDVPQPDASQPTVPAATTEAPPAERSADALTAESSADADADAPTAESSADGNSLAAESSADVTATEPSAGADVPVVESSGDGDVPTVEPSADDRELADESSTHADDRSTEPATTEAAAVTDEASSAETSQPDDGQQSEVRATDVAPNAEDVQPTADDDRPIAAEAAATDDLEPVATDVDPAVGDARPSAEDSQQAAVVDPASADVVASEADTDGPDSEVAQQGVDDVPADGDAVRPMVDGDAPNAEIAQQVVGDGSADGGVVAPLDGDRPGGEVASQAEDEAPAGDDLAARTADDVPAAGADTPQAEDVRSAKLRAAESAASDEVPAVEVEAVADDVPETADGVRAADEQIPTVGDASAGEVVSGSDVVASSSTGAPDVEDPRSAVAESAPAAEDSPVEVETADEDQTGIDGTPSDADASATAEDVRRAAGDVQQSAQSLAATDEGVRTAESPTVGEAVSEQTPSVSGDAGDLTEERAGEDAASGEEPRSTAGDADEAVAAEAEDESLADDVASADVDESAGDGEPADEVDGANAAEDAGIAKDTAEAVTAPLVAAPTLAAALPTAPAGQPDAEVAAGPDEAAFVAAESGTPGAPAEPTARRHVGEDPARQTDVSVMELAPAPAVKGTRSAAHAGRGTASGQVAEPIAVIGLAARLPGATGLDQFWDNLVNGVESLRRFSPEELRSVGDAEAFGDDELVAVSGALDDVESFDAAFFGLSAREAELTDPAQRLFLEVCQQALEHGGHAGSSSRIGVFAGSGMNLYSQGAQPGENLATRVAYRLGLTGPAIGVQAAWSSSLVAVHLACQALRSGDADLALAGAAAVHVPQATGYHASPESILSPTGHIRAFDADADGTVGGNGVAAVLLKRLDQAIADGDTVYAVIRGSAVSEGDQVELVERALEKSGVPAESISYVEASASGTADADAAEFRALSNALRKHTDKVGFCTIGSVKPNIGHLASAAGMAGLIKTILMLQHRTLVPTINYARPNPALPLANGPFVIGTEVRAWESGTPLRAGVSALDARGTSAHVILEEAPRQIRRGDDGPVVLALSAPDPHGLSELAELFRADLEIGTGHRLIDLAGTAALGRPAHRHRIAVAGSSEQELAEALGSAIPAEVPRGGPGPLGYAFTGQGAARRGMAAGLAARFPVFRSVLDECDKVYAEEFGGSLLDLLLTPASGSEGVWPTETAQPALFAFELALARLWESFGVRPALVVGHSVGEYAALCVAGALSTADGVRLTAKRGQLMQRGTVPGAMVSVRADADRVRELAKTPGVEVAAGNGPQSFVLAGSEVIVGQLAEQLDRLDVSWQRLDVDRAFHSSLVEPILSDFAEFVATIKLRPLRTPMVSSWSGDLLESGTKLDEDYLVGQLRQPVQFGDAVEALTAAGCRRFLELGPDAVLSPAGRRIAPNSTWIPAQRLGQDPVLATMNGLAELYLQGTEINWAKVYADGGRVPLPTYPFRRVHYPVDAFARSAEAAAKAARLEDTEPVDDLRPVERTSGALKRIPLDPPSRPKATEQTEPEPETTEESPFAIPADDVDRVVVPDTAAVVDEHVDVEATGSAQNVALGNEAPQSEPEATEQRADESGYAAAADPEVVAERYRESLDLVLDLTSEQLGLDPYDVTVDHSFAELGADAALMQRVVDAVQRKFDVEVKAEALFEDLITPHKLASAVAAKTPPSAFTSRRKQTTLKPARIKVLPEHPKKEQPSSRTALAVLGSGLADLAAKVDAAAAATSEADLPGSGMAALMSQQLRVASQLVEGVTKLMHEQLALLGEVPAPPAQQQRGQDEPGPDEDGPDQGGTLRGGPNPGGPNRGGPARSGPAQNDAPDEHAGSDPTQTGAAPGAPANPPLTHLDQAEPGSAASVLDEATGTTTPQDPEQAEAERARQRAAVDYWQAALSGAQPLVLPADRARPEAAAGTAVLVHEVDAGLGEAVFAFSRQRRVSPLMTMLAAVGTVLGRFAAQDDITIGAAALRSQEPTPLPLRIDLSGEPDLGELAQRVREATTGAFDHAGADLAVLEQDPLYQVLVVFEPTTDELPVGLDLRLTLANHAQGITCTADYRAGLFDESTIKRLLDYLEAVLRRAVAQPATTLPDLMLPIESDRIALRELEGAAPETGPIGRVGRNAVVSGELSGLHTLFEQQVARTPDAIALIQSDREISYAELDRRANAVAWQLVDLGVKPGQLVAVRVARGAELVVGVLAVLKSGAAYLPLDPGVPESRWAFMTADAGAVALVGDDAALADRLGLRLVPVASGDGDVRARQAPPVNAAADDVAYCIYTSGSTGNPKGVAVPHRGPVNLIRHYLRTRSSLRTLQWTSFGFDVHVQEMFTALASGAALVLIGEDDRYDPDAVVAALTEHGIERLFMTFTPLTALLATMEEMPKLPALREIVAGGEAMVLTHGIRDFLAAHPDCVLFNEYGPTEASIVTTIHQVDPADDRPSIGRPIDGVVVRLLDEALRPVPVGAVGEIHLGGVAVAQGYVGRPDETMTAFVADPSTPGSRLYRTRDLGRWRPDGTLDYLGRVDDQVKIRGHRVEPGETEHVLADLDGVIDAVVVACVNPAGDTCLIGYVVLEDEDPAVLARLMLELTKELPIYLVPADLIPIEDLPLDAAGKLDRRRLPEPEWLQA